MKELQTIPKRGVLGTVKPEGPTGPKGEPGPNALEGLNPYHDYDVQMRDFTLIHLSDVLRSDDAESRLCHFYDRRGICLLSVNYDSVNFVTLADKTEGGNGETG